jgi:hypothetical protein
MATKAVHLDFDEAAAPATPGTGDVRIYAKTDGLLYSKDDAGTETLMSGGAGGGGGGGIVGHDRNIYTGGDITLNNTTLGPVTGPTDLVVAATAGDICKIGVTARPTGIVAQSIAFDFATIVAGSPVNYVFPASGTPINIPVAWYIGASETSACSGEQTYVVQAGDISGGNVTFRLQFRSSGSRAIEADAAAPLVTWVTNHGQP